MAFIGEKKIHCGFAGSSPGPKSTQGSARASELLKIKLDHFANLQEDVEHNAEVCSLPNLKSLSVSQNVLKGLPKAQQRDEVTWVSELGLVEKPFSMPFLQALASKGLKNLNVGWTLRWLLLFNVLLVLFIQPIFSMLCLFRGLVRKAQGFGVACVIFR